MLRIIAGEFKNRPIRAPKGQSTRPTTGKTRETLFNICQNRIDGARVLDLFAGSGAVGLEALSRGAHEVYFVERARPVLECIKSNLSTFGCLGDAILEGTDVLAWLKREGPRTEAFDIIYADPPYEEFVEVNGSRMLMSEAVAVLVQEIGLLQPGGWLFLEEGRNAKGSEPDLKGLELVKVRNMGRTKLTHYRLPEGEE